MQIQISDSENGDDQEDTDTDHQDVGVTGSGDEARQMVRRGGVKRFAQAKSPWEMIPLSQANDIGSSPYSGRHFCTMRELRKH